MVKRRVTLQLDADVADALRGAASGRSMSAVANEVLRKAFESEVLESRAHRAAVLEWLSELNAKYGAPTAEQYAEADAFLDRLQHGETGAGESGAA